jgi:hypothetical protein
LTCAQLHHIPHDELDDKEADVLTQSLGELKDKLSDTKRIESYVMLALAISDSILNIFSNPAMNIQPFIRGCILYAAI